MFFLSRVFATPNCNPLWLAWWSVFALSASASPLSLTVAEQQALSADAGTRALQAQARAFSEQAIAAESWADPKLSIGTMNLPGDNLDPFDQGMLELKLEQMLPRGDNAAILRRKGELQEAATSQQAGERRLSVVRDVRLAWLDAWYWQQSLQQLRQDRYLFESLVTVTESMYSQGRKSQQDVLQAEVVLSRLDDRMATAAASANESRARLARWLDQEPVASVSEALPTLPALPAITDQALLSHPLVRVTDLAIEQSDQDAALARESYKPQWGVELTYGREQGDMGGMGMTDNRDRFSAMVMLDIPLFTGNRQDRQLSASQYRREASTAARLDTLQQLQGTLQAEAARYNGLKDRLSLYKNQLIPTVTRQADAALKAYQADTADFTSVIQAYQSRLDLTLAYKRLQADARQSEARLHYLLPVNSQSLSDEKKEL